MFKRLKNFEMKCSRGHWQTITVCYHMNETFEEFVRNSEFSESCNFKKLTVNASLRVRQY